MLELLYLSSGLAGWGVPGPIEAYAHGLPSFPFPAFYVANFSIPSQVPNFSQATSRYPASTAHLVNPINIGQAAMCQALCWALRPETTQECLSLQGPTWPVTAKQEGH